MAQFSGPKSYDPELAERARLQTEAENAAAAQRAQRYTDLGLEEEDNSDRRGGGDDRATRELEEELEAVQRKYEHARDELYRAEEEQRRAVDESQRVALIARSQTAVLRESFKRKLSDKMNLLDDMVSTVEDYEARLASAGDPVAEPSAALFEEQRQALLPAKSALGTGEAMSIEEEMGDGQLAAEVQQLRAESLKLKTENGALRKQLFDLQTHGDPSTAPPLPPVEGEGALSEMLAQAKRALADKTAECDRLRSSGASSSAPPGEGGSEELQQLREQYAEVERANAKLLKKCDKYKERAQQAAAAAASAASAASSAASDGEGMQEALARNAALEAEADDLRTQVAELQEEVATRKRKNKDLKSNEASERERMVTEMQRELEALEQSKADEIRQLKKANRRLNRSGGAVAAGLQQVRSSLGSERSELRRLRRDLSDQLQQMSEPLNDAATQICRRIERQSGAMADIVTSYKREMRERKRLFNLVQELRGNIRVYCRVRPPTNNEDPADVCATFPDAGEVTLVNDRHKQKNWEFDHVFSPSDGQADIFAEVEGLVTSVMDGYNVCLFAYGQTGAGKTHTMQGPPSDRGVNHRALAKLFETRDERAQEFDDVITVSVLEIYNEQIRDLLAEEVGSRRYEVRQGPNGMYVPDLTTVEVGNIDEVLELMALGDANRATFGTDMNEHSSRSHSMLSVSVTSTNQVTNQVARGKLHLVDLAGSERVGKSGATGARLKEAQNINKSLSALGDVIAARANKNGHVPFRNSTLTYLLQDSLSNDSKTLMIVCISPVMFNAEESFCSLNFAARARTVELGRASRNTSSSSSASGADAADSPARGQSARRR